MPIRKTLTTLALGLACAITAAPAPAAADAQAITRSVVGESSGTVTINVQTLAIGGESRGHLSHFGQFSLDLDFQETVVTPAGTRSKGEFTLFAANRDAATGTFTLVGAPPTTDAHTSDMEFTITGGTGRFTGAIGRLHAHNTLHPFQSPTPESPFIVETIETVTTGHITY